jgi:tRNA-splicing ligase RtcB (3'-phosphate/5'-hydroxy nucleic acid ligase)
LNPKSSYSTNKNQIYKLLYLSISIKKQITNHAIDPDINTLKQFEHCYNQPFVIKASLMPDAHSGYVAPIGSVLVTKSYVVPSWVGYDIGCGMTAAKITKKSLLKKIKEYKEKIYDEVIRQIPMGLGSINHPDSLSPETERKFNSLINKFKKKPHNKEILQFIEKGKARRHLGSLGHGNHFIELSETDNNAWIVIHSGSRGIGHRVATEYMKKSANKKTNYEKTYPLKDDSQLGKEYLNILDFGLQFALLNRLEMIKKVINSLENILDEKIKYTIWVNKNHNHAIKEKNLYIHRKGATPAKKNEKGVIPANMRDGSFLVEGLGSQKFLESSSHGAGRILSRTEARKKISILQFQKSMKGIKGTVSQETLDEAPQAYKNIYEVMEAQKKSVKVLKHLIPIINWKGTRSRRY